MKIIDTTGAKYPIRAIQFTDEEVEAMLDKADAAATPDERYEALDDLPLGWPALMAILVNHGLDVLLDEEVNSIKGIEEAGLDWIDFAIKEYELYKEEYWLELSTKFKGFE